MNCFTVLEQQAVMLEQTLRLLALLSLVSSEYYKMTEILTSQDKEIDHEAQKTIQDSRTHAALHKLIDRMPEEECISLLKGVDLSTLLAIS